MLQNFFHRFQTFIASSWRLWKIWDIWDKNMWEIFTPAQTFRLGLGTAQTALWDGDFRLGLTFGENQTGIKAWRHGVKAWSQTHVIGKGKIYTVDSTASLEQALKDKKDNLVKNLHASFKVSLPQNYIFTKADNHLCKGIPSAVHINYHLII